MRLDCGLCIVRDWSVRDKASLLRVANNRNVWRNLTDRFPHPYTDSDADFWFASLGKTSRPTHWAIEVEGKAVGGIGVDVGEGVHARCGHFGYWLGEPYWGRGIMTAAVRATTDHVFAHFDVVRLEAPVFEWNPASMRVLGKCGFLREGVLRRSVFKDGHLIDAVLYARVHPLQTVPAAMGGSPRDRSGMAMTLSILTNIDVDDLAKATDFYCSALELTVGRRFGEFAVELLGAASSIYLLQKGAGTLATAAANQRRDYARHWTPVHLDIVVPKIEPAVARAQRAGAHLEGDVRTHEWGRLAAMSDPFGHGFCFIEFLGRGYDEIAT